MVISLFAAEETASGIGTLGVSLSSLIIQLVTFVLAILLLKKFAFKPIVRLLEERRKVIEDGVKLGQKMEREQAKLEETAAKIVREARHEADRIIGDGQKEARDILREAEKTGKRKTDAMIADAEARIQEESERAQRKLEKDITGLVAEATEAVVEEKVDAKRDAKLIEKAVKDRTAKNSEKSKERR